MIYVSPWIQVIIMGLCLVVYFFEPIINLVIRIRDGVKRNRLEPSKYGYLPDNWRPRWTK